MEGVDTKKFIIGGALLIVFSVVITGSFGYVYLSGKKQQPLNNNAVTPFQTVQQPRTTPQAKPTELVKLIVPTGKGIVNLTGAGFDPATVTVKTGSVVLWYNKSGGEASVNSDPHPANDAYPPLNLGRFPDGTSMSLIFQKPGTYKYHNNLNPSQTGTVVVAD